MSTGFLKNNARALMIYNCVSAVQKRQLFEGKKNIVHLGSFDLEDTNDPELGVDLLASLGLEATTEELEEHKEGRRISSQVLWQKLGFEESLFIDPDGSYGSLKFDLNFDVNEHYEFSTQFDVVTNFGTAEHVFNQHQVFKNIHQLCATNGVMLHSLPIQGAWEHGFYNYHPNFFFALANANGYEVEYFGLRHKHLQGYALVDLKSDAIGAFLQNISATDTLGSLVILRKREDRPFEVPFQGCYESLK